MRILLQKTGSIRSVITNLVHNPSLTPQAMIIPDATAAVDKKWKNLEKLPIMASDKSEEQKKRSLCHLKNSGLEPIFEQ